MPKYVQPDQGLAFESQEASRLIGPGKLQMMSLVNTRIGAQHRYLMSCMFKAREGGRIRSIHVYFIYGPGYSDGTNGVIRAEIRPDANGKPDMSAQPLFSTTFVPRDTRTGYRGDYVELFAESVNGEMAKGQVYHCLFTNIDSSQQANYCSVNCFGMHMASGKRSRWLTDDDWCVLFGTSVDNLKNLTKEGSSGNTFSPVLQICMEDGRRFGMSVMESGFAITPTDRMFQLTQGLQCRELMYITGTHVIGAVSLAIACKQAGSIEIGIFEVLSTHSNNGKRIATKALSVGAPDFREINVGSRNKIGSFTWHDIDFDENFTLEHGKLYSVTLRCVSGHFAIGSQRNGIGLGFFDPAAACSSQAQIIGTMGLWDGFYMHDHTRSSPDHNFPIVLHRIEGAEDPAGSQQPPSQGGGGQQGVETFASLGNSLRNVVWIRQTPSQSGENVWKIRFIGIRNGGQVINDDEVRNISELMNDRQWSGSRSLPAIVWTGGKELPGNIGQYRVRRFAVDRSNLRTVEPWHEVGIWHEHATMDSTEESTT